MLFYIFVVIEPILNKDINIINMLFSNIKKNVNCHKFVQFTILVYILNMYTPNVNRPSSQSFGNIIQSFQYGQDTNLCVSTTRILLHTNNTHM